LVTRYGEICRRQHFCWSAGAGLAVGLIHFRRSKKRQVVNALLKMVFDTQGAWGRSLMFLSWVPLAMVTVLVVCPGWLVNPPAAGIFVFGCLWEGSHLRWWQATTPLGGPHFWHLPDCTFICLANAPEQFRHGAPQQNSDW